MENLQLEVLLSLHEAVLRLGLVKLLNNRQSRKLKRLGIRRKARKRNRITYNDFVNSIPLYPDAVSEVEHVGSLHYTNLIQEMREIDLQTHLKLYGMTPAQFDNLSKRVQSKLEKKTTVMKRPITARERLAITLRYLANGDRQITLSTEFGIGRSTVCKIVRDTCDVIWDCLSSVYLKPPSTLQDWLEVSKNFLTTWNFPHCIGTLAAKNIIMDYPEHSDSKCYNHSGKGAICVNVLAMCDASYRFTLLNIGSFWNESESDILASSGIGEYISKSQVPEWSKLPNSDVEFPYVAVGNEAFPLENYLMKPYYGQELSMEKRIFNHRLICVLGVAENAFGILVARWRLLRRSIRAKRETVEAVVKAIMLLHNYLISDEIGSSIEDRNYNYLTLCDFEDGDGNVIPGQWRQITSDDTGLFPVQPLVTVNDNCGDSEDLRQLLVEYFCREGSFNMSETMLKTE